MAKLVTFRGSPRIAPGHSLPTPPLAEPVKRRTVQRPVGMATRIDPTTGEATNTSEFEAVEEEVRGWEPGDTVLFDAALAARYGRPGDNDGADFAELFAATWNLGLDPRGGANAAPAFVIEDVPNTSTLPDDPDPAPDTDPSPSHPVEPARRRRAKE